MDDLIERLGWHSECPATGKLRLTNPDGPEAQAALKALRAELTIAQKVARQWEQFGEQKEARIAALEKYRADMLASRMEDIRDAEERGREWAKKRIAQLEAELAGAREALGKIEGIAMFYSSSEALEVGQIARAALKGTPDAAASDGGA